MSRICAIVPTFNRKHFLVECLRSILSQTRPVDDIIVVDDGSTDGTATVLRTFGDRIRVIHQENAGKAAALNAALRICEADLIWICDDDDVAARDGVAHLDAALEADPGLGFVYGDFMRFVDSPAGREFLPPWHVARPEEDSALIHFLEGSFTFQFAELVRRSALDRVGYFREDLIRSQDYEMSIRLARECRSAHVSKTIFYQRQHDGMRGTAAERVDRDKLFERWIHYDKLIFLELRRSLTLAEVTPKFAIKLDAELSRRAALLQRACIFAGKALWDAALDDLEAACGEATSLPLPDEIRLASSVIRNPLVWESLILDSRTCRRLQQCAGSGAYGRQIVAALTRPLLHLTRRRLAERRFRIAIAQTQLLIKALGLPQFAQSVGRSIIS